MDANAVIRALAERIARKLHGPRLGPSSDAHEEAIFEEAGDIKEELEPVRELMEVAVQYNNTWTERMPHHNRLRSVLAKLEALVPGEER